MNLVPLTLSLGLGNDPFLIGLPVALYSVGRHAINDRWSYYAVGSAIALIGIDDLIDAETAADIGSGILILFLVWYIGRRVRFRGERAAQLKREREAEVRLVAAEERTQIARELHDVVAHHVSLMTVQAGAAKTVAADDPESAVRAMEAVDLAGRQVLAELRDLLEVLRPARAALEEPHAGIDGLATALALPSAHHSDRRH